MSAQDSVRVLLVAHPAPVAPSLAAALTAIGGMDVSVALTQPEALHLLDRLESGVLLLRLPGPDDDLSGFAPVLARGSQWGVIAIMEHDGEAARIACLDHGADDVLPSRVSAGELAAHIRAVHRRVERSVVAPAWDVGVPVALDPAHRCVIGRDGERTLLSEAEFIALETLLDADGAPVSRDWLGRAALKRPLHSEDRSVDQLVLKLRRKLAAAGASERAILSARRQGYVITDPSRFRTLGQMPTDGSAARPLVPATG